MKRVCLCLAVLALAAPAVSVANGPPPGRPSHAGSCKTTDEPRACVRAAVAAPEAGPDESARPAIPHRRPLVLVRRVAAALCGAELKSLGRDGFRVKYTTPGACLKAMAERATAIVEDAQAQCATAQRKLVCVRAAIAKALGLPTRGPHK